MHNATQSIRWTMNKEKRETLMIKFLDFLDFRRLESFEWHYKSGNLVFS